MECWLYALTKINRLVPKLDSNTLFYFIETRTMLNPPLKLLKQPE